MVFSCCPRFKTYRLSGALSRWKAWWIRLSWTVVYQLWQAGSSLIWTEPDRCFYCFQKNHCSKTKPGFCYFSHRCHMSSLADLSLELCTVVTPAAGHCAYCSCGSVQDSESTEWIERNRERLLDTISQLCHCVESKISYAHSVFSPLVFFGMNPRIAASLFCI